MKRYLFNYSYYFVKIVLKNGNIIYYETDDFITGKHWYFSFYAPMTEEVDVLDDFSTTSSFTEEEYFQRSLLWDNTSLGVSFDEYIEIQNFLKSLASNSIMPNNQLSGYGIIWI